MAWIREPRVCPGYGRSCSKPAVYEVLNRANASMGMFCKVDAMARKQTLDREEAHADAALHSARNAG